jgi:hypothetical protein
MIRLQMLNESESNIAEQITFMKFIKNNHVGIRKSAIILQSAKQDSFGYVADSRTGARDIIKADLVTNLGTQSRAAFIRNPGSYRSGGYSAGL